MYFNELIIKSKSTNLEEASFYRMKEQGDLDKLILDFNEKTDSKYLNMVLYSSSLTTNSNINYVYLKQDIPSEYNSKFFAYKKVEGEYIIYSPNPFSTQYTIYSVFSQWILAHFHNFFQPGVRI